MKLISTFVAKRVLPALFTLTIVLVSVSPLSAQICANPANTVYGLTSSGEIRPVTISTAVVGAKITPAYSGNNPSSSNGLGYNNLNGKFYYFKRNADKTNPEFVSFDPATNSVSILQDCPTTTTIHTGCVSSNGTGYYCTDVNARLYYYNIVANTWTLITTTFFDQNGTNITATLASLTSGDIAIDGYGNLWYLCSGNNTYGLYKINAPLPVTPVASISATEYIAPTTPTPTNEAFAGVAFNPTGQMILTHRGGQNKMYRMEDNKTLTELGTLSVNGIGNDLTSCSFPFGVLPVTWKSFSAAFNGNQSVLLTWEVSAETGSKGYYIQHSLDGVNWEQLAFTPGTAVNNSAAKYSYNHYGVSATRHYYRIQHEDLNGAVSYSIIKSVLANNNSVTTQVSVWPNPASDFIKIQDNSGRDLTKGKVQLIDFSGRVVKENDLLPGVNMIPVHQLPAGSYFVRVQFASGEKQITKVLKR